MSVYHVDALGRGSRHRSSLRNKGVCALKGNETGTHIRGRASGRGHEHGKNDSKDTRCTCQRSRHATIRLGGEWSRRKCAGGSLLLRCALACSVSAQSGKDFGRDRSN